MRALLLLSLLALTACSWIPGSTVRVAVPSEVQSSPRWQSLVSALPAGSLDVVLPNSFPPADLVWFDAGSEPSEHALAANASIEALARESGVPAVWFSAEGDRVFPVAWNPWAWWKGDPGSLAPTVEDQAALAVADARRHPSLGTPPLPAAAAPGRVWLRAAQVGVSAARTGLVAEAEDFRVARVFGFWWDERGWNASRVPELLKALWSAPVQRLWTADPEWWPVARVPGDRPPQVLVLVR